MKTKSLVFSAIAGLAVVGGLFVLSMQQQNEVENLFLPVDEQIAAFSTFCDECSDIVQQANQLANQLNQLTTTKKRLEQDIADIHDLIAKLDQAIADTQNQLTTIRNSFKVSAQQNSELEKRLQEEENKNRELLELHRALEGVSFEDEDVEYREYLRAWKEYNLISRLDETALNAAQATGEQIEALEEVLRQQILQYQTTKFFLGPQLALLMNKVAQIEADINQVSDQLKQLSRALRACEKEHCEGKGECYYYDNSHTGGPLGTPVINIINRPCYPGEQPGDYTEPPAQFLGF